MRSGVFNPLALNRLSIRNHRKLLVCDDQVAFVGGFNIAPEYEGDGVKCGWCDVGLKLTGPLAAQLASSFDEMFARADFRHKRFMRFRTFRCQKIRDLAHGTNSLQRARPRAKPHQTRLAHDLARANDVKIIVAYFLPTWSLRRELREVVRRGGSATDPGRQIRRGPLAIRRPQFIPPPSEIGRGDLRIRTANSSRQAHHHRRAVYVGSSNLDSRSLHINYELMIRFDGREMAQQARRGVRPHLEHCRRITLEEWTRRGPCGGG